MRAKNKKDRRPQGGNSDGYRAAEMLNSMSKDEMERAQYHSRLMFEMDMAHNYAVAREDGLKTGHEGGLKAGRKEEALHVARNALAEHLSVETIARLTGLSRDEVEALRQ
jgi:predicted transposase/invertase (TIGR01784 family)